MATRVDHVQEPKHKVFLSHSGAQKDFVDQLCVDLERVSYVPFFDRRHASLEQGATFPDRIFDAIRHCSVFVLVLSEDFFTKTKWPMMELAEAVKALSENPNLKLLPLFFQISPSEFKAKERRACWFKCWTEWASKTSRIDVTKWKEALKVVEEWNGIRFQADSGEVEYRKRILECICRICPSTAFDIPRVVGRERFCQIVAHKFDELKRESQCEVKVPQIGVFGMGGLGKTTLCKVMCNHYFADFGGNVIHIDLKLNTIVEHQKKVIGKLTGATRAIDDLDEGHLQLKTILSKQKVFLALDNVIDDPEILEEVRWYLSVTYGVGSMILVTSRSLEVLLFELKIIENHCLEVPDLNKTEAISLFLEAGSSKKHMELSSYIADEQLRIVEGVRRALFTRKLRPGAQFHPLALKALASRLFKLINKPEQWRRTLANLDLKFAQYKVHPIFSILGSSFEMLPEEEKLIFMDVALFKPSCVIFKEDVCKWLSLVHELPYQDIDEHLMSLRMKSLLEEGLGEEETEPINIDEDSTTSTETSRIGGPQVVVHDLYVEFAKLESSSNSLDNIQCFVHEDFYDVPRQMKAYPSAGTCWPLKRIALIRGRLQELSEFMFANYYKNVKVLKLEYLTTLIDLNIKGMSCLASIDILCCYELRKIYGLQTLKWLAWLRVARCEKLEVLPNLQDLHLLEHVEVRNTSKEIYPIIFNCPQLYELRLSGHYGVKDLSNIQALHALRKLMIEWCPKLCTLPMLQDFQLLRELYVLDCPELGGMMEIGSLVALKKLHLRLVNITELGGVGLMRDLCELVCEQCPLLHKLSNKIGALTKLMSLRLSYCPRLDGVLAVGSLLALQKLHLTDIAVRELNGIGKLRCLCEFVWKLSPKLRCKLPDVVGLTKLTKLDLQLHSRSFTLEDVQSLRCIRNFLQGEVHCDIGDVNHVGSMTQHVAIVVERQFWSFMMVQSAFDADLEGTELDNDFGTAKMMPQVTVRDLEFQTTLRFFYGVGLEHVNECARRIGSPKRIVSFLKPAMSTLGVGNITVLYLEDLQVGHLQLIGMTCLSTLYIRRCKRLSRPVILEAMMVLEDVKMADCEYLDDDCTGMRIRKCTRLRKVTITKCKKLRPIFVSNMGSHHDFQDLPIEDISDVHISANATWTNIEWYHNMHVKVNIECCDNIYSYQRNFDLLLFKLYVVGIVPAHATGVMNMMTQYGSWHDFGQKLCCWTLIVLQSISIVPDENFMKNFDAILGGFSTLNIALHFAKQDFETMLCFFDGVLCEQVLQYLPNNWSPIRIVSFTGYRFQILNQENTSKRLGNITTLHLNNIEFDKLDLQGLECLIRLELRNVCYLPSGPIVLDHMPTLEYIKLVDLKYGIYYSPALSIHNCPRLQEVILDKCFNVRFVFEDNSWENQLRKLLLKDCPHLLDIHWPVLDTRPLDGYLLGEVQCINCPKWRIYFEIGRTELVAAKVAITEIAANAEMANSFAGRARDAAYKAANVEMVNSLAGRVRDAAYKASKVAKVAKEMNAAAEVLEAVKAAKVMNAAEAVKAANVMNAAEAVKAANVMNAAKAVKAANVMNAVEAVKAANVMNAAEVVKAANVMNAAEAVNVAWMASHVATVAANKAIAAKNAMGANGTIAVNGAIAENRAIVAAAMYEAITAMDVATAMYEAIITMDGAEAYAAVEAVAVDELIVGKKGEVMELFTQIE